MSSTRIIMKLTLISILMVGGGRSLAELPERKLFQFGEFTIEASEGDEAYVEALAVQLAEFKLPEVTPPVLPKLSLGELGRRRDSILKQIATYLGLNQPTKPMGDIYDGTLRLWQGADGITGLSVPRSYVLWRKPELHVRLERGEALAGFRRDESGGLMFDFKFEYPSDPEGKMRPEQKQRYFSEAWSKLIWPVSIGMPDLSPESQVRSGLARLSKTSAGLIQMNSHAGQSSAAFAVLHEATELGVVASMLSSKDRRWFCDGVANYVAWKIIEAEVGQVEAKKYYDLAAELAKFASLAGRVDLSNWPAAEDTEKSKYPDDLNNANYAFATKVIADVCAKHGDDLLPRLFKEIGKTPRERATIETVYRAFKKLTREDLRSYLPKPVAKR